MAMEINNAVEGLSKIIREEVARMQSGALDTNVCLLNWCQAINAGNEDVGPVTVAFQPALVAYAANRISMDERADAFTKSFCHKMAAQFFVAAFQGFYPKNDPWGSKCRFNTVYESPLIVLKNGNHYDRHVANAIVKVALFRMSRMVLTPENMEKACLDLQDIARMYQERTIDAAKTALKVVIDNLEGLRKVKLDCRQEGEDKFNIRFNWDENQVKVIMPKEGQNPNDPHHWEYPSPMSRKKKMYLNDIFNIARCDWLNEIGDFAGRMVEVQQVFSEKTLAWLETIGKDPNNKEVVEVYWFVKELYQTLTNAEGEEKKAAARFYENKPDLMREAIRSIKDCYKPAFAALSNMLRVAYTMKGLSPVKGAAIALYTSFFGKDAKKKEADSRALSSFAHVLLEQEMLLFVLQVFKDDPNVPKTTENRLAKVEGIEDGEVVTFTAGRFEADGKTAICDNAKVDGEFTVVCKKAEKEGGKDRWYACRSLAEMAKESIPAPDRNQVLLLTQQSRTAEAELRQNYSKVLNARVSGQEVELRSYGKLADGTALHDNVVLGGSKMLSYRSNLGRGMGRNEKGITAMYNGIRGVVTASALFESKRDGSDEVFRQAFLVVKKTAELTEEEQAAPIAYTAPVVQAPAAPAKKTCSFAERLAKVQGTKQEVVVSAPAAPVKKSSFEGLMARANKEVGGLDF